MEKRIQDAVAAKELGSEALKAGDLKRASFQYKLVHMHLGDLASPALAAVSAGGSSETPGSSNNGMVDMLTSSRSRSTKATPELQTTIDTIYAASLNNLALVHLKLHRFVEAIACASRVLQFEGTNTKALFRRGKARVAIGLLDEARQDYLSILALLPEDADTLAALTELASVEKVSAAKEKKMFQKMFA